MLRLLCLLVGLAATVHGQCDEPFHLVGEGCYYFSLEFGIAHTWVEARGKCQDLGTDVDLAVLDTLCDDYRYIENYLLMADAFLTLQDMWVGATGNDETWLWIDGRALSVSSSHWYYSEPDTTSGCVILNPLSINGYERIVLYEEPCSYSNYYICQKNVFAKD